MAQTWFVTAVALAFTAQVDASAGCLDQLVSGIANTVGAGQGYVVKIRQGIEQGWFWSDGEWVVGKYKGHAAGAAPPGSGDIWLWPEAFGEEPDVCSPRFMGQCFPTLAHEILHFLCPGHAPGPAAGLPFNPEKPPAEPGMPPDCNDINYAVNAAELTCEQIGTIAACLADPMCPGLVDEKGAVVEGLERRNLPDYCASLVKAYDGMQKRWNTEENVATAFGCNCPDQWSPGRGFANCPTMGSPSGGCSGSSADAYPDKRLIPDCAHACP